MYREEKVSKADLRYGRLKDTFNTLKFNIDDELINLIAVDYIEYLPKYNHLIDGSIDLLEYLKKKYQLHIITNGFKEVQATKLNASGLNGYFKTITTSEEVGVLKPNPKVFHHALDLASAQSGESVYVGDHFDTDVMGSKNAGIDQVFFNPHDADHPKIATVEIRDLVEMIEIF